MRRCLFTCQYEPYEESTPSGGYIQGLRCKRCKHTNPVARVSEKGAELQTKIEAMRLKGISRDDEKTFQRLLIEFQREVQRL